MRTSLHLAAVALAAGVIAAPALAQGTGDAPPPHEGARQARGGGPADVSPERRQIVWTWEARTVAAALELDDAAGKTVAADWIAVREDLQKQLRDMAETRRAERPERGDRPERAERGDRPERGERGERGGRGGRPERAERGGGDETSQARGRRGAAGDAGPAAEMREKAMASLRAKLAATLSGETLDGAMKAFDVPTIRWDRATDAIVRLELDPADRMKALRGAHGYLAGQGALRDAARDGEDRAATRQKMQSLRSSLQASLTEAGLSDSQMRTVMTAINPGRGGQGAGDARGRGDRGNRGEAGGRPGRGAGGGAGGGVEDRPGRGGRGGRGGGGGGGGN